MHPGSLRSGGLYKSAVLLASLGADLAAQVLSHMAEREVEVLVQEVARLDRVPTEDCERVLAELGSQPEGGIQGKLGGPEYARSMLERAVGPEKADRMLSELDQGPPALAAFLQNTPAESLAAVVADEAPQTIALLLWQLPVEEAAAVLSTLHPDVQGPVALRYAKMEAPTSVMLQHLEDCLLEKLHGDQKGLGTEHGAASRGRRGAHPAGTGRLPEQGREGPRQLADILGKMRQSLGNCIMAAVEDESPSLALVINQYRFTFGDILELEGRSLQRIFQDTEVDTLRLAMRGLAQDRWQTIFENISQRTANRLRDDLASMGPTRLREVEAAQLALVAIARKLHEAGEVHLPLGDGTEEGDEDTLI